MDLEAALAQMSGAARREDLLLAGVSESALRRPRGVLRPARGVYALSGADRAVVLARQARARIGCVSAAVRWGLPVEATTAAVHLVVPRDRSGSRGVVPTGVVLHRHDLREDWADPWVTCLEAIDTAALCASPAWQMAMIDAAIHCGLLREDDLERLRRGSRPRRRWLRTQTDSAAESPLETLVRVAMQAAGWRVSTQVDMPGVGRVDMVVEECLVIEVDGGTHFGDRAQMVKDRRRDRGAQLGGLKAFRYVYAEVVYGIHAIVEEVARAVGKPPARGWEGRLDWLFATPPSGGHPRKAT